MTTTRRAATARVTAAVIITLLGGGCWLHGKRRSPSREYLTYFGDRIYNGMSVETPISVKLANNYDVILSYAYGVAEDIHEDLERVTGSATLSLNGQRLIQASLPTGDHGSGLHGAGMVLFSHRLAASRVYEVKLRINNVPESLARARPGLLVVTNRDALRQAALCELGGIILCVIGLILLAVVASKSFNVKRSES